MATETARRSRPPVVLAAGQVRYQLVLLLRSPLGFFLTIVVPLLLLISPKLNHPPMSGHAEQGRRKSARCHEGLYPHRGKLSSIREIQSRIMHRITYVLG